MQKINRHLTELAIFIFFILISTLYAFILQWNPFPPSNIILWATYCYIIFRLRKHIKRPSKFSEISIVYFYLLVGIYIIYLIKSTYYVAYFNEFYFSGTTSIVPFGFERDLSRSLIYPDVFLQKLQFFLSWDQLSISFGENNTLSFGGIWSNAFRIIEILGILFASLIFNRLFNFWNRNSQ